MTLLTLYRLATGLGGPLFEVALQRRARQAKEDPERLGERLGRAGLARPDGPLLWLHAASVGEALAVLPLIEALLAVRPALEILLTTGTVSSARLIAGRLPARARHQFAPVDRQVAWRQFFAHWRPALGLLAESELWPNLILEARRCGLPLALINARMSARSHRRWGRARSSAASLLGGFELCLAQSAEDGERFRDLGARRVAALGNLKSAAPPLPADPAALHEFRAALGDRPVWVAASTHPEEEAALFEVHRRVAEVVPAVLTILVPRHPERGAALAARSRAAGLEARRRAQDQLPGDGCAVYVGDTLGELGLFYRLARVAFVGKSLVPYGGQNPLEAARLGCPVLFGPHMDNFRDLARRLEEAGGARVVGDPAALAAALVALLTDPGEGARMAACARAAAAAEADVLAATLAALDPLLARTLGTVDAGA